MAKSNVGWAAAFFAGLMLLFLGALVVGLQRGALWVPAGRFGADIERASNPYGFYLTAALHAGLAGLAGYPLWLLLQHGRGAPRARPAAARRGAHGLDLRGRVAVSSDGRGGTVQVALEHGSHAFAWEFGGGDCVAIVAVPTAAEWPRLPALAPHPREHFLAALAREVGRLQCPHARHEIEARAILFRDP